MKSRLPVHWSFISPDKNVIHALCVNNIANPKMKSFNSYVFVLEARHEFFLQMWKNESFKVLAMLLKVKYQFFVAITVWPRRWVQVISRHLDNMMLATTATCGIRLKNVFRGICIDYYIFCLCDDLPKM